MEYVKEDEETEICTFSCVATEDLTSLSCVHWMEGEEYDTVFFRDD